MQRQHFVSFCKTEYGTDEGQTVKQRQNTQTQSSQYEDPQTESTYTLLRCLHISYKS